MLWRVLYIFHKLTNIEQVPPPFQAVLWGRPARLVFRAGQLGTVYLGDPLLILVGPSRDKRGTHELTFTEGHPHIQEKCVSTL